MSGTLSRYLKSQDAPPSNNQPLQIIVGSNFNDVVMRNTKDVLIEFYAPWCSHCQQLEPILVELAKRVSHNPNLIIAKCDATVNEVLLSQYVLDRWSGYQIVSHFEVLAQR